MNNANIPNDKRDAGIYLKGYLEALVIINNEIILNLSRSNMELLEEIDSMIELVNKKLNGDCDE